MKTANALTRLWGNLYGHSVRRRLVMGVALVHAVLMSMFITDLVHRQREFMRSEGDLRARGLARMVAVNSVSWVLANDVRGLAEVIGSVRTYPDVLYAMVVDSRGKVLGHTDESRLERWVVDDTSRTLLLAPPTVHEVAHGGGMLEVAAPVTVEGRVVGWARIGLDQRGQAAALRAALREGLIYTIAAIAVGTIFALWIARRLTSDLVHLGREAELLGRGERKLTPVTDPPDEIALLEQAFQSMATTIWRREDALTETAERLQRSNAELEQFADILAHHLQEPVRLQYSFTQRLRRLLPEALSDDMAGAFEHVLGGAARLRDLLRDVQLYLSIEQLPPPRDPCPAEAALHDAEARLAAKISAAEAVVTCDPLPGVLVDRKRLTDVFATLLDNAIQFRQPGDTPRIHVGARDNDGMVELTVTDNGIGVEPEFHTRVFRVFERLHPEVGYPGTGIGLPLAKRIVEHAGGRMWLDAAEGGGTRVSFTLRPGRLDNQR